MTLQKMLQIQDYICLYKIDILVCQEVCTNNASVNKCDFISSNFTLLSNNSLNDFGTLVLIKNNLPVNDFYMDTEGRAICVNIGDVTIGNFYPKVGSDASSRQSKEKFFAATIPNLLINKKQTEILLGYWNAIVHKDDCTHHPDSKMSPCIKMPLRCVSSS